MEAVFMDGTGVLEVEPKHIGKDTTFGKIIEIIEQSEKSKAPIQKVADKIAARLVYCAFAGAIATFLYTHNIVAATPHAPATIRAEMAATMLWVYKKVAIAPAKAK